MRFWGKTRNNSVTLNVEAVCSSETSGCRNTKKTNTCSWILFTVLKLGQNTLTDSFSQWTCWRRPPLVIEDKTAALSAPPQFSTWGWKQIEVRKRRFLLESLEDGQEKINPAIQAEQWTSFHSIFLQFFSLVLSPVDCNLFHSATAVHV